MMREMTLTSMLPPEITQATWPSAATLPWRTAARLTAPAPSTICFDRSSSARMVLEVSSSSTVTRSSA